MEFTPITTQEALDGILRDRLERERAKYADYDQLKEAAGKKEEELNAANEKISEQAAQINDLSSKVANYERDSVKTRVAIEHGLPYEMANRLTGSNEAELAADAENLAKYMGKAQGVQRLASTEGTTKAAEDAAYTDLAKSLVVEN